LVKEVGLNLVENGVVNAVVVTDETMARVHRATTLVEIFMLRVCIFLSLVYQARCKKVSLLQNVVCRCEKKIKPFSPQLDPMCFLSASTCITINW
jgi:hypothetical protein